MAINILVVLAFITLLVFIKSRYFSNNSGNYPPSPGVSLPFIGHLHRIGSIPHVTFLRWSKIYGSVFSVKFGEIPIIVINEIKLIREVLSDSRFNGRPNISAFNIISGGQKGILNNVGHSWTELRKFTLQNLKSLGVGQKSMDSIMHQEISQVLESLASETGSFELTNRRFMVPVVNVLWSIAAGQRFDHSDFSMIDKMQQALSVTATSPAVFFPSLASKFPKLFSWNKVIEVTDSLKTYQKDLIRQHKASLDEQNPRDFIDLFLIQSLSSETDEQSSFHSKNAEPHLIATLNDLLLGGSETTASTICWAILCLSINQTAQRKIQQEIDSVIGPQSIPSINYRPHMPYTIASIMETLRLSTLFPLGAFHATTETVNFYNYTIPTGSIICLNLWAAHHDPVVWTDPEKYRPERFLEITQEGATKLKRSESSIPFSYGKRSCLGELLAKEQLFLFVCSIFQKFSIALDPAFAILNSQEDLLRPRPGFMSIPPPFKIILSKR